MTTDARIKKSTKAILRAGLELLTVNKDAKLTDVASKAGVGRATLYRLFKNKDDLVLAITHYCIDEYELATQHIEKQAKSALHAIELYIHATMPLTLEFQFLISLDYFVDISPEFKKIEQQHKAEMIELIEEIKKEVPVNKKLTNSWLYNVLEGLFFAGWLQQTADSCSAEQAAELAYYSFKKVITD